MAGIYEIYIDSLFLTNFLMDMLSLYLTGIFLRRRIRLWRLLGAAALGSVLGIVLFLILSNYLVYELVLHFICNPMMVWLCFGDKKLSAVIKSWLSTYLFMLLTGGIMQWINQTLFGGRHLYAAIFMTFVLGYIAALLWERKHTLGQQLYHVTLQFKEHEVSVEAYYDTGNLMTDPFCGKPVSIVDCRLIEEILRQEGAAVRMIPFSSVGKESGLMKAVTIEELRIEDGGRRLCIYDPVIGMAGGNLFAGKTYRMILNCRLLRGQGMPS
ncbi:MAG: sigma-E processing peptidase SpoIIGA [Lachnospiraceae bacterium]|nr:sigma-E processing peptidase SpoIIGA [Lachnospiraceae bacterium]